MATQTLPSGSEPFVVDSSGWLEYVTEDEKAGDFAPYLESASLVLVPTIVIFEVYKKIWNDRGKHIADQFYSQALRRSVIGLDEDLALATAAASIEHHLAMADAIIYATARAYEAKLITSDTHFQGLPGVTLI